MQATGFMSRSTPPHLLTLVLVTSLAAMNMNIFLPALPAIASYFNADYAVVQLAISGYLAVTALAQIIIGPLSDRYGRRPVLLVGLGVFLAATVLLLLAPTIEMFLAARMLQAGVVAGLVLPRVIIRDVVDTNEAASRIGYVTMGMSVVPMASPALGGFLSGQFGWHSTFVFEFIFSAAVFALCWADVGETNPHRSKSLLRQFANYPELFRSRRFWGYALTASFSSGAFYSFLGGAPYVATVVLGMGTEAIGAYFAIIAIGYLIGNYFSGRLSSQVGVTRMMVSGCLIASFGMILTLILFLLGMAHPLAFFGPTFFVGMGNGVTLPSANAGMVSVRPHLAGSASGLGGTLMIGGGALLSSLVGALLTPESGIYPLIFIMLVTTLAGLISTAYVAHVDRLVLAEETGAGRLGDQTES